MTIKAAEKTQESVPVSFTDLELWALWELAKRRNDNKDENNVRSRKVDRGVSDVQMHYIGMKAEYGVAKLLGVEFNSENILSGDGGIDILYRGKGIDVKYSQLDLKFKPGTFLADIAILAQPLCRVPLEACGRKIRPVPDSRVRKKKFAWKHIVVVGWITREEFAEKHEIRNFGYNDLEFLPAYKMHTMRTLATKETWRRNGS